MAFLPPKAVVIYSDYQSSLLNTESITSGWLDMESVDKVQFSGYADTAGMRMTIESKVNNTTAPTQLTTPVTYSDGTFYMFNVICRQRWMRFTWENTTGGTVNDASMEIKQTFGSSDKLSVFPVGVNPSVFSQAALVQSINRGKQPDGDYVAVPADGTAISTSSTLTASSVFTSSWIDSDGYNEIDLLIACDQVSEVNGVEVQFTDDANAATPTVIFSRVFTFSSLDVNRGYLRVKLQPTLDGFRIVYTNGSTDQTSFFLVADLRINGTPQRLNSGGAQVVSDFGTEVALGEVPNYSVSTKFGRNSDIDTGSTPEDMWNGGGEYTGFNPTQNRNIEINSTDGNDTGSLITSGTATGGSSSTIEDTGATFVSDGVAVGDLVINDTNSAHGFVTAVTSETVLTVFRMTNGAVTQSSNSSGDDYRIASNNSTGASVVRIEQILNSDYEEQPAKYAILDGTSNVTVTVDAFRCTRAKVIMAGSSGTNEGTLRIRQQTDTSNIFAQVPTTGQTTIAAYTVPVNKVMVVKRIRLSIVRANGSAGSATINMNVREPSGAWRAVRAFELQTGGIIEFENKGGLVFTEGYDIKYTISSVSDNNTVAEGAFEYYLINE